ncbi:MAG: pyridoxal-phosphate dependent enzyme [Candidatus Woesearchaeota archaeon]
MGLIDKIGNTQLLCLTEKENNFFIKLEGENPSGSIKDRLVDYLVTKAEEEERLRKGQTLIEISTGNTGVALSMIAREKGYKVEILLPPFVSKERIDKIENYGGKAIVSKLDWQETLELVKDKVENEGYFWLDQYRSKESDQYYMPIVKEIDIELKGKQIDYLLAAVGTGGTVMGIGKVLKAKDSKTKVIAVESDKEEPLEGVINSDVWKINEKMIYSKTFPDEIVRVKKMAAEKYLQKLNNERVRASISSGAVLYAAEKLADKVEGKNFLLISPDGKMRKTDGK